MNSIPQWRRYYFFIYLISVEEKSEPTPTVSTTSKMFTLFGKKNKNNQEQAKNNKPEKEEDPYAGFGVEEVAAPLQTDDLEYDEGFQVSLVFYFTKFLWNTGKINFTKKVCITLLVQQFTVL